MLILDVFSETSSFGIETNRIASSDIGIKKTKTLKTLKEVAIFFAKNSESTVNIRCPNLTAFKGKRIYLKLSGKHPLTLYITKYNCLSF